MSFASTMNAILRNNRNLRTQRNKFFDKYTTKVTVKDKVKKQKIEKHLSEYELEIIREEIKEDNRVSNLRQLTLAIILFVVVGGIILFILFYLDPDKINIFKRVEMFFSN